MASVTVPWLLPAGILTISGRTLIRLFFKRSITRVLREFKQLITVLFPERGLIIKNQLNHRDLNIRLVNRQPQVKIIFGCNISLTVVSVRFGYQQLGSIMKELGIFYLAFIPGSR
jgi:hypothetical protein